MIKITAAVRASLRTVIARSRDYDANTVRIARNGTVTALKDANKTSGGHDSRRYVVGLISDMVRQDGAVCEGY